MARLRPGNFETLGGTMWTRKKKVQRVVDMATIVHKGRLIPIYFLDDGTIVWRLNNDS